MMQTNGGLWVELQLAELQRLCLEDCAVALRSALGDSAVPVDQRAALAVAVRRAGADLAKFDWAYKQYLEIRRPGPWAVCRVDRSTVTHGLMPRRVETEAFARAA